MTLVSIITPAYKAEKTLGRAVRSAQAQKHTHWEMIIVSDDGQDYEKILAQEGIADKRLKFSATGKIQSGPSCGRNIALEQSQGEFITTLDADDEYAPDYLGQLWQAASVYGAAMTQLIHKQKPDGSKQSLLTQTESHAAYCGLLRVNDYLKMNGCSITMFSRRFLKHRYPENIRYGEDFYFDIKFFDYLDIIPIFYEELYIYHHNPASLTNAPMADELFIENYKKVISDLESDSVLSVRLKNMLLASFHHRLFQNYLYLSAKHNGECRDFYEFMAQHPEHFK